MQTRRKATINALSPRPPEEEADGRSYIQEGKNSLALNLAAQEKMLNDITSEVTNLKTLLQQAKEKALQVEKVIFFEKFCTSLFAHPPPTSSELQKQLDQLSKYSFGVNSTNASGTTLLYCACHAGHTDMVFLLLQQDNMLLVINLNPLTPEFLNTPLHVACFFKNSEVVAALLICGANPQIKNKNGTLPSEETNSPKIETLFKLTESKNFDEIVKLYPRTKSLWKKRQRIERKIKPEKPEKLTPKKSLDLGKITETDLKNVLLKTYGRSPLWFAHDIDEHPKESIDFINNLVDWLITNKAYLMEGITRLAGSEIRLRELMLESWNGSIVFSDSEDPYVMATLLKRYLRFLDKPLLTFGLYKWWIAAANTGEHLIINLQNVFLLLPEIYQEVLKKVLSFYSLIVKNSDTNLMTPKNCAIPLQPCIFKFPGSGDELSALVGQVVIQELIVNYSEIFERGNFTLTKSREQILSESFETDDLSQSMQGRLSKLIADRALVTMLDEVEKHVPKRWEEEESRGNDDSLKSEKSRTSSEQTVDSPKSSPGADHIRERRKSAKRHGSSVGKHGSSSGKVIHHHEQTIEPPKEVQF